MSAQYGVAVGAQTRANAANYWGEALTFAQLLWGLDYADSARTTMARLGATLVPRREFLARIERLCASDVSASAWKDTP